MKSLLGRLSVYSRVSQYINKDKLKYIWQLLIQCDISYLVRFNVMSPVSQKPLLLIQQASLHYA